MPAEHRAVPSPLETFTGALNRSSAASLEASHELLAHYSDTGDAPTQRAVDALLDHAADALRALTDSFADISGELQAGPTRTKMLPTPTGRSARASVSPARSGRRRDY